MQTRRNSTKNRNIAKKLVQEYIDAREYWPPKYYNTKEVTERAIRSLELLLTEYDEERIVEVTMDYIKRELSDSDFPYSVANWFGRKAHWLDWEKSMKSADAMQKKMEEYK